MDYIPVYEGEDSAPANGNELRIAVDRVQKLGVRTEPAAIRNLQSTVTASGRVEIDERRVIGVTPRFEGYVETLHVNATGQPVAKGQPLFEMYSPELVSVQREYAIAMQAVKSLAAAGPEAQAPMQRLADASLARLRAFDVSEEQIRAISEGAPARRTLTFRAPVGGVVLEKKAVQGMRFMPGDMLYQIGDLSAVWVIADVNEQDIGQVRTGTTGKVQINAYPDRRFNGRVTYIYPTLKPETRTIPVRFELANPGNLLKPGMYAQVELASVGRSKVLTVPNSAVIDSGTRRIVLVQKAEGRFEPREVALGYRSDDYVEVVKGVKEGEPVVTSANFLIDAESNLRAAIGTFTAPDKDSSAQPAVAAPDAGAAAVNVGHKAEGTVDSIDPATGAIMIAHGPVAFAQVAGDDHGVRAGQPQPHRRASSQGSAGRVRVRGAQARRVGHHLDQAAGGRLRPGRTGHDRTGGECIGEGRADRRARRTLTCSAS